MVTTAPGLENGLKILEMVADNKGIGFNQLKTELGLSPASLNRYLKTLMERNYIKKNENQQYIIGKRMMEISKDQGELEVVATKVQPLLENISAILGSTSIFFYFKQGRMICTSKFMVREGLTMQDIGESRTDYVLHPWGYLLLASLESKVREVFIENVNIYEACKGLEPDSELLDSFIYEAGEHGYSDDKGKIFRNTRRIAVPVYLENNLVGALGVGILGVYLEDEDKENIVKVLRQKAETLSGIL